jgi:hypothetical protein
MPPFLISAYQRKSAAKGFSPDHGDHPIFFRLSVPAFTIV